MSQEDTSSSVACSTTEWYSPVGSDSSRGQQSRLDEPQQDLRRAGSRCRALGAASRLCVELLWISVGSALSSPSGSCKLETYLQWSVLGGDCLA